MRLNQEKKSKRRPLNRNLWPPVFQTSKFAEKIESCGRAIFEYIKFFSKRAGFVFLPQKHILRKIFVFLLIFAWIFSGFPPIWQNPRIPPKIEIIKAADGSGTNTVDPTTATAESTGNTFTFTFTAAETMNSGELKIKVPNSQGWSIPQGSSGTAGYTTAAVSGSGMIGAVFDSEDAGWIEDDTDACNIATDGNLGLGPDGSVKYEGLGSILCNNTGSTAPDAGDSFGFHFPARDLSSYSTLTFWIYSDVARSASVIQAALDNNFSCASPLAEVNVPALNAGEWTQVNWDISGVSRTAVKTFCINNASGSAGFDGAKIYIDDVQLNGAQLTNADYFHGEDDNDACNIATDGDLGIGFSNSTVKEGLGSLVCNNTGSTGPDAGDSFGIDFPTQDWSSYTKIGFWIYTTVATNVTNYIQAALDNNFSCASPLAETNLTSLPAGAWTYVVWDISGVSRTSVRTFCFNAVGTGMDSRVIYVDEILVGPGALTFPANGSDTDISARILQLANTETITVTYGSGGGSSGVTAPSATGDYEFTTRNKVSVSGTLTNIASHPVITVQSAGGTITTDIVDASYNPVSSPTMAMNAATFDFACQTVTGTFGTASQRIYVNNNNGANNGWTLTLAAQATTNVWDSAGTDYDFNDPTSSGCADGGDGDSVGGQMTVDPSVGTLTVGQCGSCSTNNISKGSLAAFNQGTTDTITLLSATAASDDVGDWVLTDVSISQKIPAEQPAASDYDINMVLTVTAN